MKEVVVGLDLHLQKTQGVVMSLEGKIIRQERFLSNKDAMKKFLKSVPKGTEVALESLSFCWPWIEYIEKLGYKPLLANPARVKQRAEDVKTDKVDAELLANLTRMNWLPTCYVPSKELRNLRSFLRHRIALRRHATAFKNRAYTEMWKRGLDETLDFGTIRDRTVGKKFEVVEISQDLEIIDLLEKFRKEDEKILENHELTKNKIVQKLRSIPGIGLLISITLFAEICDIKRFPNPDKLAHYSGLVPKVKQTGEKTFVGREVRQYNKWLKWLLIEAAWSHIRLCPKGRLAKIFSAAYKRKRNKKKAIKIVARKLVNIIWAVWTYEREFDQNHS